MSIKKTNKVLFTIILFSFFLAFSLYRLASFVPAQLVVEGVFSDGIADVDMQIDSGNGTNSYERDSFIIQKFPEDKEKRYVRISYNGDKNSLSPGKELVCAQITIDGKNVDFREIETHKSVFKNGSGLHIENGGYAYFELKENRHIHIELLSNYLTGNALIDVNGNSFLQDLYTQNYEEKTVGLDYWFADGEGRFLLSMELPRYKILQLSMKTNGLGNLLTFSSVSLKSEIGERQLFQNSGSQVDALSFNDVNEGQKRFFYPKRFVIQVVFSILTCWAVVKSLSYLSKFNSVGEFFLNERRYVFWIFWLGAIISFSLWLAAFWPGVMSIDSLKIWRAAKLPEIYLNDHPFLNVIFYMYLIQFWDNIAVVPVAHILLISFLTASVFFFLYRQHMPLFCVVPLYFFCILSVPIGIYNTILWKDVPFAILIILWGCILSLLYNKKKYGQLNISMQQWFVLALLYLSLGLIRHNGAVYLIAIPVFFVLLRLISFRKTMLTILLLFVFCFSVFFVSQKYSHSTFNNSYFMERTTAYLYRVVSTPITEEILSIVRNYPHVLDINYRGSSSDLWHYYLNDRYAYDFLRKTGWNDVHYFIPHENIFWPSLNEFAYRIYQISYEKPWVYLTWYPAWVLLMYPLTVLFFRWTPHAAIFSCVILVQLIALLFFVDSLNWRYYYFACLGAYFLIPILFYDIRLLFFTRVSSRR